ncbi:hypothetical protein CTAYLR_006894 [Chrysophaeum taylorii]|uniref:Cathepsin propeptide inhibitor domain-containing protein n=1 Tax=Chrysophaeum taylorii TaxID=2483200 RepID=A0AAD7UFU4_9STRA|nr:hypothetical protein CTAYLR_006894 [Chrysophaeum taylorii]
MRGVLVFLGIAGHEAFVAVEPPRHHHHRGPIGGATAAAADDLAEAGQILGEMGEMLSRVNAAAGRLLGVEERALADMSAETAKVAAEQARAYGDKAKVVSANVAANTELELERTEERLLALKGPAIEVIDGALRTSLAAADDASKSGKDALAGLEATLQQSIDLAKGRIDLVQGLSDEAKTAAIREAKTLAAASEIDGFDDVVKRGFAALREGIDAYDASKPYEVATTALDRIKAGAELGVDSYSSQIATAGRVAARATKTLQDVVRDYAEKDFKIPTSLADLDQTTVAVAVGIFALAALAANADVSPSASMPSASTPPVSVSLRADAALRKEFTAYCIRYNKRYYDDDVYAVHFERWKRRFAVIQRHNSKGLEPQLELNAYADLPGDDIS